jgi:hypothetical protein
MPKAPEVPFAQVSSWAVGRVAGGTRIAIRINNQQMVMTLGDAEAIGRALMCEAEELGKFMGQPLERAPQTVRRSAK